MRKNTVLALSIAVFLLVSLPSLPKTSAQAAAASTSDFSPPVKNTFSWHASSYFRKKGPIENYDERVDNSIDVLPSISSSLLGTESGYVEVWRLDNQDNRTRLLENIPAKWVQPNDPSQAENYSENYVVFREPAEPISLISIENVQINGRRPPFHTESKLSDVNLSFDVSLSPLGKDLKKCLRDLTLDYFYDNYYLNASLSLDLLTSIGDDLSTLPINSTCGSIGRENVDMGLSLSDESASFALSGSLKLISKGFSKLEGVFGSHSISWTVSSKTDWQSNTSENVGTEMVSEPDNLKLMGGKYWDNFTENNLGDTLVEEWKSNTSDNWSYDNTNDEYTCPVNNTDWKGDILVPSPYDGDENFGHIWARVKGDYIGVAKKISGSGDIINWHIRAPDDIVRLNEYVGGSWETATDSDNITLDNSTWYWLHVWYTGDNAHLEIYENGTETSLGDLAAHIERSGIDVTGAGYWGINVHSASSVQGEVSAWGKQRGKWTSQVWDSGHTSIIENVEYSAAVGFDENVLWNVEATDTGENTGWFKDEDNLITQSELPNNIQGENFQLSLKLETDNTTHSPSIQDYTLSVDPVPTIRSVSIDNALIDRDIDNSGGGAVDATQITARVRDNDGRGQLAMENTLFTVKDNNGTELISKTQADSYENVNENTKDFTFTFNPSDDLSDDNLGSFDVDVDVNDTSGATDNVTSSELFSVGDWTTTWDNTLPQHLRDITISGTADNIGGFSESLSSVTVEDGSEGSKTASISGLDWDVTFSELGATEGTTVDENVLLSSDNIDGKITDSYTVQNTPPGAPENLTMPDYDNRKPNFLLDHLDNDANDMQKLEIEVGTTAGDNDVWDSGTINLSTDNYIKHLPDLSDNTTYYYRIRTADEEDWGPWSDNDFYLDISLVPSIDAPSDGEDVTVNYEYDLKSSVKYSGLENLTYSWDFDDGATATGPNPTHAWGSAGTYNVTLTVSEENTVSASDSVTINVVSGGGGGGGGATAASGATWENPKAQEPGLAGIPKGLLLYPIFTIAGFTFQLWMGFGLLIAVSWAKDKKKLAGALFLLLIFLAINYGKFLMVAGS